MLRAPDREFTISRGMPVLEMKSAKEMNGPFPEVAERSLRIDDAVAVLIFLTCSAPYVMLRILHGISLRLDLHRVLAL
ncbi:MAG: hypothetical protein Ct9H300mP19_11510 [Dehalococcoidia bacterium]|nr:MAG: hypothetical protein Ct9H300mP19_11510 [Dehalococcoidia bacterium]